MVTVDLWGKSYPLCLTVAALDKINEKCGGISGIASFLDGGEGKSYEQMLINTAWFLALLIKEGEENRRVTEQFSNGLTLPRQIVPEQQDIYSGLTIGAAARFRAKVLAAISESMTQEIEAVYRKKKN